jgi:hypothetical protein
MSGIAHERHFPDVIRGSDDQQDAQQEAMRSRHGRLPPQTTHHEGRTIRSASRPIIDSVLLSIARDCT